MTPHHRPRSSTEKISTTETLTAKKQLRNEESAKEQNSTAPNGAAEEDIVHCPCCGKQANLLCTRCRVQKYCSRDCQKTHWLAQHKKECQSIDGRTILVDLLEEENNQEAPANIPLEKKFVLKVQVALGTNSPTAVKSPMMAYDQSKSVFYLISRGNCRKATLLDRTVRAHGQAGGAKAYFNAKIRSDRKMIVYLDQRHTNLEW